MTNLVTPMKLHVVRRLAAALAVLVLLLGHAWAGPTLRAPARPCCCKPGQTAQTSVARAKCCGQSERRHDATHVVVRAPAPAYSSMVAVLPSAFADSDTVPAQSHAHPTSTRPPDHGIGRGLSYRLRV